MIYGDVKDEQEILFALLTVEKRLIYPGLGDI